MPGVPAKCGNARPLETLTWMNPADFNSTTLSDPRHLLEIPAPGAPIFVVGCGHSGTTHLITMLHRHPEIFAYLDGPGMEFAVKANSFYPPWSWLPVRSMRHDLWLRRLARQAGASHWWGYRLFVPPMHLILNVCCFWTNTGRSKALQTSAGWVIF